MKNKLMKVSLLLFLMVLIAGKSLSQNQSVRIKAGHPRLILSGTDIELMRRLCRQEMETECVSGRCQYVFLQSCYT